METVKNIDKYPVRDKRSVKNESHPAPLHSVRDASLIGCRVINVSPVSTERYIPNGMPKTVVASFNFFYQYSIDFVEALRGS